MTDLDVITLGYAGRCACGATFAAGEPVGYDRERHTVVCSSCLTAGSDDLRAEDRPATALRAAMPSAPTTDDRDDEALDAADLADALAPHAHGRLGAHALAAIDLSVSRSLAESGERETTDGYRRRHAEESAGGMRRAGRGEPSDRELVKAAKQGDQGERALVGLLNTLSDSGDVRVLTERRVPGSRAHLDHLVVAGTGVFVVDAQRYAGAPIAVRQAGGMFGPRRTDLYVRGRQRNDLVGSVERLAASVRTVLDGVGLAEVPVTPVLCLVGASFPMFQPVLPAGDTSVVGLKALRKLLGRTGGLRAEDRDRVYVSLAASLPAMT